MRKSVDPTGQRSELVAPFYCVWKHKKPLFWGWGQPTDKVFVFLAVTKSAICTYSSTSGCLGLTPGDRFESQVTLSWQPVGGGIVHTEGGSVWKAAE